jgi:DNA-binding ferritin-like protein
MKHRLTEAVSAVEHKRGLRVAQDALQKEMAVYDGKGFRYADLAVWLAFLRALGMVHQSHHWQTLGPAFYGDHLLFQRLYEAVGAEVDAVAEKLVGLDSPALTNYFLQMKHMKAFMDAISNSEKPPMVVSLQAEMVLIAVGEMIQKRLEEEGLLTVGVANLLGDILDRHEGHVYLLQQRLAMIT